MRKGKKITFLVTILCALALLISWFSITPIAATALAEDTNNKVTATTTTTVKQGDTVNCYVYIDSLESLSSLNVAVHFDPDKVSVTSSFNSVSCSLYDSSINESYVQFSYIFDGNGEDTKAQLFYFQYKVLTNAEEGAAHFDVVVSEAYDSSLNVANISGSRCPFTIAKKVTNKTCTVSGTSSVTTAIKEEFELSYRLNTTGVASGSFVIRYDAELFEFVELSVGGLLENKFYDIKTDQPGVIYASFVGTEYASNAQLLTVKFKTIRNATQSSQIKLSVTDFYDLELNSIGCNGYTTNVHLTYDPTYSDDAPTMTVSTVYSAEKQQVTVTVKLDAGSYLGAGDFVLNFNTEYFTYNSATKGFVPTFFNINDKKASEGIVKFSIISLSDIVTEEIVLTVILDTPVFCNDVIADFDIGGNGLADSMTNPILINFVDSSLSISGVGHDLISHPAKAPTCTEIGWYAYDTCSRCDYTTYVEIPANGHRYVHTLCSACGAKQPTYQTWDVSANGDGSLMANLYENVVEGGYELELSGSGVMKDWVSPSDTPWYYAYRTNIRYLLLEEGMTSIGVHAFDSMTALTDVTIPDSVKVIGHYAFYGCTSLASVSLPTQLEQIGDYAFAYTTALEEIIFNATAMADLEQYNYVFYRAGLNGNGIVVTIGKNVSKIPAYLFSSVNSTSENPKIIRVTFEEGSACTTIGARAFAYCTSLESIELPEGLSTIGSYAFYYCTSLESVELCEGLTTIDSYAFYQCIGLTSIEIPDCVSVMGQYAFAYCTSLESIELPDDLTTLASYVFCGCTSLKSVAIPARVTSIGGRSFQGCTALTSVTMSNAVTSIGGNAFDGCTALQNLVLSDRLEIIEIYAFYRCTSLVSITIPESVTSIGDYAFAYTTALEEIIFNATAMEDFYQNNYVFYRAGLNGNGIVVTIGKNVTRISTCLFSSVNSTSDNPKIIRVTFEEGSACTTIGERAFAYCTSLVNITIPESVTSIGRYAFRSCSAVEEIVFNATSMADLEQNNYVFYQAGRNGNGIVVTIGKNVTRIPTCLFSSVNNISENPKIIRVTFEEGSACTTIGERAFAYVTSLESIEFPEGLSTIGSYAFENCTSLVSVTVPESVTSIGGNAFAYTTALEEIIFNATAMADLEQYNYVFYRAGLNGNGIVVTIGKNVSKIPAYLFSSVNSTSENPKIIRVTFEEGSACTTIGARAFAYCTSLESIELPEGLSTIGSYAFYYCTSLESIELPEGLSTIGSYAFYYCTSLACVELREGLSTIGSYAFYYCTSLESITIPESVTSIGDYAFAYTTVLEEIIFNATAMEDFYQNNYVFYRAGRNGNGIVVTIGKNVSKIPACLFSSVNNTSDNPKIIRVTFEEGSACTTIGERAFAYVTSLESIEFPEGLSTIGSYAFENCTSLVSVTVPESVTSIGGNAFAYTTALEEIIFNATAMADLEQYNYVFYRAGLNGNGIVVTIGKNVSKIPAYLFSSVNNTSENPKIIRVTFEEESACTTIGERAFACVTSLESIELPEGLSTIGSYAFYYCTSLACVELREGLSMIDSYAFENCTSLESIELPEGLSTIGSYAFYYCTSLESITIPASVTSIGSQAFYQTALTLVYVDSPTIIDQLMNDGSSACGFVIYYAQTVVIPAEFSEDDSELAARYVYTESIVYDGTAYVVYRQHDQAWSEHEVLVPRIACQQDGCVRYVCTVCGIYKDVTIPMHETITHEAKTPTCTEIGWDAYDTCSRCDYTTYVEIVARGHDEISHSAKAPTCTGIGWYAYETCSRCDYTTYIERAVLGHDTINHEAQAPTCTEIGWHAYDTCSRCAYTTYVEIAATGHSYTNKICVICGEDQPPSYSWDISVDGDGSVMAYCYALTDGNYLMEIVGSGETKNYSDSPFYAISGKIGDIFIEEGVATLGNSLFQYLHINGNIYIPNGVTSIGDYAFYGFSGPKTVSLPDSVDSIGNFAFYDSKDLIIILQGDRLPSHVGSIWDYNCGHYIQPQDIVITDEAIYVIDKNGKAWLAKCYVNQPEFVAEVSVNGVTVTGIGAFAFDQRNQMLTYTVPAQITAIGQYAFRNCFKLTVLFESNSFPSGFNNGTSDGPPGYTAPQKVILMEDRLYILDKNGQMYFARYLGTAKEVTVDAFVDGIPVQYIGEHAFAHSYIDAVTLPNTVIEIGGYAFIHSTVKQVNLPDSLKTIGTWGFFGADLTSIVIPENVTEIYWSAFSYCDYLKVVYIKSPTIAQNISNASACGNLCSYAQTVVVLADVQNNWLIENYSYKENTYLIDKAGVIYSNCIHSLQQINAWEMIPCERDGGCEYLCENCGVEKKEITPCHDKLHHNAQDPTCTEIGWDAYDTCSRCDYTTYVEIPANGHSYGEWEVILNPTCTMLGTERRDCNHCDHYETRDIAVLGHDLLHHSAKEVTCTNIGWDAFDTCSRCDYTTYVEIPATGHSYGNWEETKAPTCLTKGSERRDCHCGHFETREVAALGHDIVHHNAQVVTCTVIGWDAYDTCTRCDYTTYVEISATGHTASDWMIDAEATYEADGSKHKECTVCGETLETSIIPMLKHSYVSVVTAPTCTERGYTTHTCSDCGNSYVDDYVPAEGHSYGKWEAILDPTCTAKGTDRRDCDNCDHYETREVAALGHDIVHHNAQVVTCTVIGWDAYDTCSRCDYTTYVEIPATGHTASDWMIDAEATYEADGSKHKECTVCGETLETSIIPMLKHSYVSVVTAPTCTERGYTTHTCSDCGNSYVDDYVPAEGHSYGKWEAILDPTCTAKGTDRRDCDNCDHYETREVAALGHDIVHHNAQVVTCTVIGWDAYDTCTRCDYTTYVEIPATGHTASDWMIDAEATYEADGSKHKECTVCGETLETSIIPMLKHSYVSVVTAPTCTEQGYTTHTCSDCGDSYIDDYVEAVGHHFGEWVTIIAQNCIIGGQERRDCDNCDHYENRDVDALGHDIVSNPEHSATCTEIGWNAYETCLRCDHTTYVEIPATGHFYSEWIETTAPTCTENGKKAKECSVCYNIVTEVVDKLGHDEVNHDARAASCDQIGWNAYVTCSRCDYTTYVEIPMLTHSFGEWTETLAPTCTETGTEQRACTNCSHSETRDISALNHDRIAHEAQDATCTEVGWNAYVSCSRCNYSTYVEIPSKGGHVFGAWVQTIAPGSATMGQERRDCDRCDYYETKDIEALGYLQTFIDAVADLSKEQSTEITYNEIYTALQLYAKLTDEEKQDAKESFLVLQTAIESYNAKAMVANDEMEKATEVAFVPISASFAFLAALWFLLKKKFWIS